MTAIRIRPAGLADVEPGTELIYATMESMADYLFGADDPSRARVVLSRLFLKGRNRYSYRYADLAEMDGQVVGLLLSYSGKEMRSLRSPMAWAMLAVGGLREALRFLHRSLPLVNVQEADPDEYFINNVAVFPQYWGRGVGTRLLEWAERKAATSGFQRCALTVEIGNRRAVRLYEHLGYRIVETVKIDELRQRIGFPGLYRMVKCGHLTLTPAAKRGTMGAR